MPAMRKESRRFLRQYVDILDGSIVYTKIQLGPGTTSDYPSCIVFFFVGIAMCQSSSAHAFRPAVTVDDWKIIMAAIEAYSHNSEYRDLLGRLERQAVLNGIAEPQRHSPPPQTWDRQ